MIGIAVFFIVLGILIKHGKMHFLIAGYNTMSKKEKEYYNIEAIATVFRNVMFGMALLIIVGYVISRLTENSAIQNYAFWVALLIGIPYLLVVSNAKKYRNKKK
jgi:glycopeptide antibiotics resistance protein